MEVRRLRMRWERLLIWWRLGVITVFLVTFIRKILMRLTALQHAVKPCQRIDGNSLSTQAMG